jgi:hypothetical protein
MAPKKGNPAMSEATTETTTAAPAEQNNKPVLQFETVKHVTLPTLKMELDQAVYVRFEAAIYQAKALTRGRAGTDGQQMAPPELAHVTELTRNRECTIIVNSVLGTELRETYPNDGYVGKSFKLVKSKLESRRYATFDITEVRLKK